MSRDYIELEHAFSFFNLYGLNVSIKKHWWFFIIENLVRYNCIFIKKIFLVLCTIPFWPLWIWDYYLEKANGWWTGCPQILSPGSAFLPLPIGRSLRIPQHKEKINREIEGNLASTLFVDESFLLPLHYENWERYWWNTLHDQLNPF